MGMQPNMMPRGMKGMPQQPWEPTARTMARTSKWSAFPSIRSAAKKTAGPPKPFSRCASAIIHAAFPYRRQFEGFKSAMKMKSIEDMEDGSHRRIPRRERAAPRHRTRRQAEQQLARPRSHRAAPPLPRLRRRAGRSDAQGLRRGLAARSAADAPALPRPQSAIPRRRASQHRSHAEGDRGCRQGQCAAAARQAAEQIRQGL